MHYLNVFVRISMIYVESDCYIINDERMCTVTAYKNKNLHLRS